MFVNKQVYFLIAIAMILSLFLVQQQVFAQWSGPTSGPGGGSTVNPPATNPMDADLDLANHSIIGGANATFSGNVQVGTINAYNVEDLVGGGGGLGNPMTEDLDAAGNSIFDLGSCNNQAQCDALSASANQASAGSLTTGIYATTKAASGNNPSYAIYGVANNAGGTAILGLGNSDSWAGYFYGYLGASKRLVLGEYPTRPATPANSGGLIELGKYDTQSSENSSLIYSGTTRQDQGGIYFDAGATGNGYEMLIAETGQLAIGPNARNDLITDEESRLIVDGKIRVTESVITDGLVEIGAGSSATVRGGIAIGQSATVTGGSFGTAIGYGTGVSGFRSMALGNDIDVTGAYSLGIGLDYTSRELVQANTLAIMGGKVGINELTPITDLDVNGVIMAKSTTVPPIIGWGYSGSDFANAGVEGIGEIGVYAFGSTVGLYADGQYGAVTRGTVPGTVNPPDDPEDLGAYGNISSLFGVNRVLADVNTPAALGSVTIGGYVGGGTLVAAGLGLCALSGEVAWGLDNVNNYDYFTYCRDAGGKNNYAGFFAGDVYVKNGSIQINDSLTSASENLIYANASSAASGSNLIKLQNNGSTKFYVNKDGVGYFASSLSAGAITSSSNVTGKNFILSNSSSYIDFNGGGTTGPACKGGDEGLVYYFSRYNVLCACSGSDGWKSLMNNVTDNGYCSNNVYTPR